MVLIAAGYMYNKRQNKNVRTPAYNTTPSFSNPVYELSDPEVDNYLNIDYEDKPQMEGEGYMDVSATASDV